MRLVPINCIKEGSFLAKSLYDTQGRILLTKGTRLTDRVIKKSEEIGILSLYINDEYSDNEIEDVIKPELRNKAINTLKDVFGEISPNKSGRMWASNSIHKQVEDLSKVLNDIIDEMISQKGALINLVDIKSMDNYTYEHSVNVIILSLTLGIQLNMSRDKLFNLAMGAMMHDIGKVFVPKEILQKNGKLNDQEFAIVKEHPLKGYEYLKDSTDISPTSRIIALQHHEKVDGTGYPGGIKGDRIHEFAKIAAIADVYDALTSDRPYRMAMTPNEAIEYLMGGAGRHFDFRMVNAFVKNIVPYPIGTLVRLSNGNVGVIEEVFQNYPLRPRVKVFRDGNPKKIEHIDLMEEKNIVIEGVQYEVMDNSMV